jgi:hypothetical protein
VHSRTGADTQAFGWYSDSQPPTPSDVGQSRWAIALQMLSRFHLSGKPTLRIPSSRRLGHFQVLLAGGPACIRGIGGERRAHGRRSAGPHELTRGRLLRNPNHLVDCPTPGDRNCAFCGLPAIRSVRADGFRPSGSRKGESAAVLHHWASGPRCRVTRDPSARLPGLCRFAGRRHRAGFTTAPGQNSLETFPSPATDMPQTRRPRGVRELQSRRIVGVVLMLGI